jgi:hypothetical protein
MLLQRGHSWVDSDVRARSLQVRMNNGSVQESDLPSGVPNKGYMQ